MARKGGPHSTEAQVDDQPADGSNATEQRLSYDPKTDSYRTTFSPAETSTSIAIVDALTDIRHCSTADLEPLYDTLDTDALDALVESAESSVQVRFSLDGFGVLVSSTGRIEVTPPE
ncbi:MULTISPECIES: HalOD1 output domain-containing protein [Haloarcula]|uniref:Halobacterial output domain-containing protein n=1 Tax=Haloarcula pellucida TaxID=1427151 RepID=A0A830GH63_9EURY|nr:MULTISPECIES: HalOD1 output domain-containing protein [Halomicroarcula]MBX0347333.1 hypothetical protein [Halomicroarcula pellucida]MDS0276792.1 hypothetical protein [Halomicroarcula sp. S1AR25-4]GGN88140.1 hypothetical protein GCM10009030_07550 [Halomicroarcula pellucida]